MGQYYKPMLINPEKKNAEKIIKWWYSFNYGLNGLKLMEHSYYGNKFVNVVENELINNPQHLVWAGDYADSENDEGWYNLYDFSGEIPDDKDGNTDVLGEGYFVVNHTKKQYYDRDEMEKQNFEKRYEVSINPLPLLTAEGNGRGGGDYHSDINKELVGVWARDLIEETAELPSDYEKITPYFME